MDKSVRRVTLVQGSGDNRVSKVVYDADEDDDGMPRAPDLSKLEQSVRHMLKAQMIAAQEAYQQHIDSAAKEGNSWLLDAPGNFFKVRKKAMKEMRKANPFGKHDDDKED
jgi:hypothetical protein